MVARWWLPLSHASCTSNQPHLKHMKCLCTCGEHTCVSHTNYSVHCGPAIYQTSWQATFPKQLKLYKQRANEITVEGNCLLWGIREALRGYYARVTSKLLWLEFLIWKPWHTVMFGDLSLINTLKAWSKPAHHVKPSRRLLLLPLFTHGFGQLNPGRGYMWIMLGHFWIRYFWSWWKHTLDGQK